jgi:hypothetical protein
MYQSFFDFSLERTYYKFEEIISEDFVDVIDQVDINWSKVLKEEFHTFYNHFVLVAYDWFYKERR